MTDIPTEHTGDERQDNPLVAAPEAGTVPANVVAKLPLETISPEERAEAADELRELAANFGERMEAIDSRSAGGVSVEQRTLWKDALRRFLHNRGAVAALVVMALFLILSVLVPMESFMGRPTPDLSPWLFSRANAYEVSRETFKEAEQPPSLEHPFGTDRQGRDMWKRAWLGGRVSLAIAFAVSMTILLIGMVYGSISGYVGGKLDMGMMRFLDSLYGLPYIPFAIIFTQMARARFPQADPLVYMVPALSLTTWFTAARIMRSQVLTLKNNDYVEAAVSSGARWYRIIGRHIVPNTLGIMVVAIFLEVPGAILGEAVLSFLGLGVELPDVSWGKLAGLGYNDFRNNPHLVWVPGLMIAATVLAAIAVADGARDALDPRGRSN